MALILNSGLPAGSRGLWWFAQGLENLGTVATGDAVLNGSALTGGVVVHDATTDTTTLAADSTSLLPTAATSATIMLGYRKRDGSNRASAAFGVDSSTDAHWCHVFLPFSDGTIYWDFGGNSDGFQRLAKSGETFDTSLHVWGFTLGSRGHEIWLDGVKIASNAQTAFGRTATTAAFRLGEAITTIDSDLADYAWVFIHDTQLAEALIEDISADPEGELTEEAPDSGSPWLHYAKMRG